jgi:O-antigen biosynthesis protein
MNDVAIIIPTMDNRAYLEPCLLSLADNTRDVKYQIYVVNNGAPGSCDGLYAPHTIGLDTGGNIGWERGLQRGLDMSNSPLVLFLNDDTLFLHTQQNWLAHLVNDLDDPTVAAAGPSSNMVAGSQSITQQLLEPRYLARYLIGFCLLVRRSTLDAVGGIDTTLPGGDDIDLSIRFRVAGYKLVCDRQSFVYHYGFRTGERVHGGPSVPGGWNSQQMIAATANALIAKHGQAAFDEAWRNDPLGKYHTPIPVEPALP